MSFSLGVSCLVWRIQGNPKPTPCDPDDTEFGATWENLRCFIDIHRLTLLDSFFLGLICFCFSLHPGQKAAWHSQAFSPWAIPNEGGMHLSILQLKQQSKISQTLAHGPVESVHGLGNRTLASNAQGLGVSPQYCKAKRVKRLLWWSYCPCCLAPEAEASPTIGHQPAPGSAWDWIYLTKNIKHPSSIIVMSLTELEETLAVCSDPHHCPGVQQPRAGKALELRAVLA